MFKKLFRPMLVLGTSLFCQLSQAAYVEAVDGELSSDPAAPTAISVIAGSNTIAGVTALPTSSGRDIFEITLVGTQQLDAIVLNAYSAPTVGNGSFFAVQAGSGISVVNPGVQLGQALIGQNAGNSPGDNVLDDLGGAGFGGIGFAGALTAGTYTFWFQETAGTVAYEFDFQVSEVPLPGAVWLLGTALLGLGAAKRKKA